MIKYIEHVVRNAKNTWKNIYLLHKPSDFLVDVKDDDAEDKEKDEEENIEEVTHFDNEEDEKDQGQEATEEAK